MKPEPPLLMLAAGRRPRARRAPKSSVRELSLHYAVVDLLTKLALPGWAWTHFPSGEARDARTGGKLKRMGTKPGWPDLILISPRGIFFGLELKAPDGELSEAQQSFQIWAVRHGIAYSVVRSLDEALIVLGAWKTIRPIAGTPSFPGANP